ncbi:hypothetical protein [Mycobacteroides abscessus]|uniref:hypothetical protein n=1 Tax=Mycobacteroides abscessus TaxID=36809 RepID=UPI0009C5CAA8|nr:hypothetical protein [Mycobacteroides abscessus]SLB99298.1 Uncharacterised protein [Mycobacteroides abscessus subsp. abscessus]SLG10400.1 Uncharacterised protein [Mycobacteroides abscessus subsp. abscessus]
MSDAEPPLTPVERLTIVGLYAHLTVSQNRSVPGQLGSERACYADHDIHRPETLSHNRIPVSRASEGLETC